MASSISEAQAELISTLTLDDIPIKLRCAICSKLAVNAFRLPCCEQAVCDSCQSNLPAACPICEHSPLSPADCNPNKSLRTTIRVFLRTAEKKREASRAKPLKLATPADAQGLATMQSPPTEPTREHETVVEAVKPPHSTEEVLEDTVQVQDGKVCLESPSFRPYLTIQQEPKPMDTTEETSGGQSIEAGEPLQAKDGETDVSVNLKSNDPDVAQISEIQDNRQQYSESADENYAGQNNSGMGDFNQMQMMMAMQNGMGGNSFNGMQVMGMPGMGMDPMTMQNMYMNGGFQGMGMGMNGMNGVGGYGGGIGQGSNFDWNGSQSWNFDQNNYNQSGDFGNFNSGFQTGYNGNYGQQFNDYRRNNFGRGRGRGRGYQNNYGRGGFQYGGNMHHMQNQQQGFQQGPDAQAQSQNDPESAEQQEQQSNVDEFGRSVPQEADEGIDDAGAQLLGTANDDAQDKDAKVAKADASDTILGKEKYGEASSVAQSNAPGFSVIQSVLSTPKVPMNAPTGPKAMRQGPPNTGFHNLRARGFQVGDATTGATAADTSSRGRLSEAHKTGSDDRVRSRSSSEVSRRARSPAYHYSDRSNDKGARNGRRNQDAIHDERVDAWSPNRIRNSSRTPCSPSSTDDGHRSSQRRKHRQGDDDEENDRDQDSEDHHRKKRYRHSHRHRRDEDDTVQGDENSGQDGATRSSLRYAKRQQHSRTASPDGRRRSSHKSRKAPGSDKYEKVDDGHGEESAHSNRKSSHRSHRDKDREHERDHHRDRDRDGHRDRSRRHDRESEREKDRKDRKERHRDRDRDRDRDEDKDRDRERGKDRQDRRHGSRKHSVDDGKPGSSAKHRVSISGGTEIKETSHSRKHPDRTTKSTERRESTSNNYSKPQPIPKDPHTLEREARDRERLLKEAQRMASFAGSKRGRDGGDEEARKSRRSRRSEAVDGEDEERVNKLEKKREGGRWG